MFQDFSSAKIGKNNRNPKFLHLNIEIAAFGAHLPKKC